MLHRVAMEPSTSTRSDADSGRDDQSLMTPDFALSESKLRYPAGRPGIVARPALIDRFSSVETPLISIVAPAGYGKTTLLAQWGEIWQPRLAWVSADHRDNDPAVLSTYLAAAVGRIEPLRPAVLRTLVRPGNAIAVVPLLASAIGSMRQPIALVLDNAEVITNRECIDTITELALSFPAGSRFAIASRDTLLLPAGPAPRARRHHRDRRRRPRHVRAGGGRATRRRRRRRRRYDVDALVQRTEGWPTGLYLAALAMRAGSPRAEAGFSITGDDRFVGDYLRSELLDRVSRAEVTFLTRTSILDRMCGGLCAMPSAEPDPAATLESLESRNLLVVPLDRRREWYRYHHLFRELLHAELTRREPELVARLHSAAAQWYEANPMPEAAIDHAMAAGDAGRVARLVLKQRAAGVGQWPDRHGAALDGVARGPKWGRALLGRRCARCVDFGVARQAGRGRTLGRRC